MTASGRTEPALSAALEELHGSLVLLGGSPRGERTEVAAFTSLRVFLSGIESVFPRSEFPDHDWVTPAGRIVADWR
jgi:hypothetical protein